MSVKDPFWEIAVGAMIAVGGAILTGGGYLLAATSPTGGKYYLFWGAIFWGGIQVVRGLLKVPEYRRLSRSADPYEQAQVYPVVRHQLIYESFQTTDDAQRQQYLELVRNDLSEADPDTFLAAVYILGLAHHSSAVRVAAGDALLHASRSNKRRCQELLGMMMYMFSQYHGPAFERQWAYATISALRDKQTFQHWSTSGKWPDVSPNLAIADTPVRGSQSIDAHAVYIEVIRDRVPGDPVFPEVPQVILSTPLADEHTSDAEDDWADSLTDEDSPDAIFDPRDSAHYPELPPLESYDAVHVQNHRGLIKTELAEYKRAFATGELQDETIRQHRLNQLTYLDHFLEWYRSADGERARWVCREDVDLVIEHYLGFVSQ